MICLYYISACAVPSCRSIYLSICLSISVGRHGNVLLHLVFVLVVALWFFVRWFLSVCAVVYGPCLRASRGNRSTLIISIVGSSRRDRNAERNAFLVFS